MTQVKRMLALVLALLFCFGSWSAVFAADAAPAAQTEPLQNVPMEDVDLTDGFWRDYQRLTICEIIPAAIANVEKGTGGMPNIINAAKLHRGESHSSFSGALYVDSDVHKVLESMCYALTVDPMEDSAVLLAQQQIREKLEEWIPDYLDAQDENGYFDTYYILQPGLTKYSDVNKHELYCMGHFIEAALAHYACTDGADARLLEEAIRVADHLAATFGTDAGQRKQIPGHQEIELALLKLALLCQTLGTNYAEKAQAYSKLAAFFLDTRGDYAGRANRWTSYNYGNILQDPWVQYDFDAPVELGGCEIWWYDDQGGVQLPDGFEIYYKSGPADFFAPVQHDGVYTCDRADTFQTYTFAPVSVTSLRLVFHVSKASAGIVEWKLLRPQDDPTEPANTNTPDASEQNETSKGFFARLLAWWNMILRWFRQLFAFK